MVKYQGPVPEGFSVRRFRETGRTSKMVKGKEVSFEESQAKKAEKKSKKKKEESEREFLKKFKKRLSYKKGKSSEMTVVVKEREPSNIFSDPNRFFKNEWEEVKKTMFLK